MEPPVEHTSGPVTVLGPTLRFKGELHADEDIMIQGRVEGSIHHSQRLTVGSEGHVKADITGQVIDVKGSVEGDLTATASVSIASTAHLKGDIYAPSISIVEGADFNGHVQMDNETALPARSRRKSDGRPAGASQASDNLTGK